MENKLEKIKKLARLDFNSAIDQFAQFAHTKGDKVLIESIKKVSTNHRNAESNKKEIAVMSEKLYEFKRSFEEFQNFVKDDFDRLIDQINSENNKILFLASNPSDTPILKTGTEFEQVLKEMREELSGGYKLDMIFKDVKLDNFFPSIVQHNPRYIHFSGHGTVKSSDIHGTKRAIGKMKILSTLIFPNEGGNAIAINEEALTNFVKINRDALNVQVIFLNACYSASLAAALSEFDIYVIGMEQAIYDRTAISFAVNFYKMLQFPDIDISMAFSAAQATLGLDDAKSYRIPTLYFKSKEIITA